MAQLANRELFHDVLRTKPPKNRLENRRYGQSNYNAIEYEFKDYQLENLKIGEFVIIDIKNNKNFQKIENINSIIIKMK